MYLFIILLDMNIEIVQEKFEKNDNGIYFYDFHILLDNNIKLYFYISDIKKFGNVSGNSTDLEDIIPIFDKYNYFVIRERGKYGLFTYEFICNYKDCAMWSIKLNSFDMNELITVLWNNLSEKYDLSYKN